MVDKQVVMTASRELREGFNLTQTQFGKLIGRSLNTVQRIETLVPASGAILATMHGIAIGNGRERIADVFLRALAMELGVKSISLEH